MQQTQKIVINIVLVFIIAILIFLIFLKNSENANPTPTPSTSNTPIVTVDGTPTTSDQPYLSASSTPVPTTIIRYLPPATDIATCSVDGEIRYYAPNAYDKTDDTKITYKNIDTDARNITWKINPDTDEEISVGPNLMDRFPIPNGEQDISVTFYDAPEKKRYTLTAEIGYGVLVIKGTQRYVEVRQAQCSGNVDVIIDY